MIEMTAKRKTWASLGLVITIHCKIKGHRAKLKMLVSRTTISEKIGKMTLTSNSYTISRESNKITHGRVDKGKISTD